MAESSLSNSSRGARRRRNSSFEVDEPAVAAVEQVLESLRARPLAEEQVLLATLCALNRQISPEILSEASLQYPFPAHSPSPSPSPSPSKPVRAYLDGCFDLMHSGHYNAIRQAKALCDELVVGVHSDAEILRNKGPPVMNDDERMAAVRACKWIDQVEFDTPYTPSIELLDRLKCDFCVHGDDTPVGVDGVDAYAQVRQAGRFRIIKRTEGVSTTDLVGRLLLLTKDHHLLNEEEPQPAPCSKPPVSSFLPTTWRLSQFANHRKPTAQDVVVYVDGSFDMFHVGHIEALAQVAALGTFVYVGLLDDETVNQRAGSNLPIMNLHERVLNVLSCKYVDEVVMGAPWRLTSDLVRTLNVSVVALMPFGLDYVELGDPEQKPDEKQGSDRLEAIRETGTRICRVETSRQLSTDDVIRRIVNNRSKYQRRNQSRVTKEQRYLLDKVYVQEM